ncbi:MAG: hypothetical protein ABJO64_11290 [Nitratireductor sp.]
MLEDNIGRWWWTGDPDAAWGLDQLIGSSPAYVEKIARTWYFRDPRGKYHETMRGLFSEFRLGRCRCDRQTDHVEKMHRTLAAMDAGLHARKPDQMVEKLFDGSRAYFEDYLTYLEDQQIITCDGRTIADLSLSREGQAILLMLRLTANGSNVDCSPAAALRRKMEARPERFDLSVDDIDW